MPQLLDFGAIRETVLPEWTKPENASVFDPVYRAPVRTLIKWLGLDDPQQAMALGVPLETGPMAGGAIEAIAKRFPRFAEALKTHYNPELLTQRGPKGPMVFRNPHTGDVFEAPDWGTAQEIMQGKPVVTDKPEYRVEVDETAQLRPGNMQRLREKVQGKIEWPFEPVFVRREGNVYKLEDGHHRAELAREMGLDRIPAQLQDEGSLGTSKRASTELSILPNGKIAVTIP